MGLLHTVLRLTKDATEQEYVKVVTILWTEVFSSSRIQQTHLVLSIRVDLFDASCLDIQTLGSLKVLRQLQRGRH